MEILNVIYYNYFNSILRLNSYCNVGELFMTFKAIRPIEVELFIWDY